MAQWNSANSSLQAQAKTLFEVGMNNNQSLLAAPWQNQVAMGKVPGVSLVNLYGYQASVSSTWIPIWENATVYAYPPNGGIQMLLYSSSASDTAVSITITGLDSTFAEVSETLILTNGATGVTTVNTYRRINAMRVVGSNNPVGIIRLASSDKATTYAQIAIGVGRSQASMYNVPAGYTFYLNRVTATASATTSAKILEYRVSTLSASGIQSLVLQAPWVDTYETLRVIPNPYAEKTSIQWQINSDATAHVGLRVEGFLVNNAFL